METFELGAKLSQDPSGASRRQLESLRKIGSSTVEQLESNRLRVTTEWGITDAGNDEENLLNRDSFEVDAKLLPLQPTGRVRDVAAVDVSCVNLAQDPKGSLIAVRGAAVLRGRNRLGVKITGPLLFYVTYDNKRSITLALRELLLEDSANAGTPALPEMPLIIGNIFERWLQREAAESLHKGLLLLDGSLGATTQGSSNQALMQIISESCSKGNSVLAFSKNSNLMVNGTRIADLCRNMERACLLQFGRQFSEMVGSFGDIYATCLTPGSLSFRLDIVSSEESHASAVGDLISSDAILHGYPELLVLAHVYCSFNKIDVLGIQGFLAESFGVTVEEPTSVRDTLFMPFDHS